MTKHKLNIHHRGSPWGSRTQQHANSLRYAHSQHTESHLSKKQPQAKIPIAFLFSQLHFNNVTSPCLFYGGHLVMRSKRCAVQNQGITLNRNLFVWLIHCWLPVTDWSTDWLTDGLIAFWPTENLLTDWLMFDWLNNTERVINWLADCLIGWFTVQLTACTVD